jgi:hypothetical protein
MMVWSIVVPQPSTRLMKPRDTATVGDVIVIPSVTNEFGGPVGEAVIVDPVTLQRSAPAAVVTGQNITLAVAAAIMQSSQVCPRVFCEYDIEKEGLIVHIGAGTVAKPFSLSSFVSQLL